MSATWSNLQNAGLTFGDVFMLHGDARKKFSPIGRRVRIEHHAADAKAVKLVDAESGEYVNQCAGLNRAAWWIA